MCLIITGKAETLRTTLLETPRLLEDIYKSNPDGIGVMFPSRRGLRIHKKLPKNADQARHFLSRMPGDDRNLAVHFRWQTHGFINKENCHPYVVVDGECALMHNGVLRTGNDKDRSKSDTWHFIRDYLESIVKMAPDVVHDTGFKAMLRDFIGSSNRFVVMTKDGSVSVINAKEGVEHKGLWFSNTYAWTPSLLIEGHRSYSNGYQGYQGGSYQGGQSFRGGRYGGRHGYGGTFVEHGGGDFGDPYDDFYSRTATAPAGSPAQSGTSGTHSSGGSGTVHNGGVTAATRFSHRREDEQEEEAWRKVVSQTQRGWSVGAGNTPAQAPSASTHQQADRDPPEEGEEAAQAGRPQLALAHAITAIATPTNEQLAEALLNADVDTFCTWLEKYPTTVIHMLFVLYTPEPTKWCKASELDGYSRFLYDAVLNEDKRLLIGECERKDGSASSVAEVICFYLNWLTGRKTAPKDDEQADRTETKVGDKVVASTAPTESSIEPTGDDCHVEMPHEVRGAVNEQMGQDEDGFASRDLYMG